MTSVVSALRHNDAIVRPAHTQRARAVEMRPPTRKDGLRRVCHGHGETRGLSPFSGTENFRPSTVVYR